jgi:HlyD family secretion protein
VFAALGLLALGSVTVAVGSVEKRPPSVERGTLWIDTVHRGTMLRQVRAPGTLQPEHVRFVSAVTAGRIERILVRPDTAVTPATELLELTNPDVQLQELTAEQQLAAAQSQLVTTQTQLESARLTQAAGLATVESGARARGCIATLRLPAPDGAR